MQHIPQGLEHNPFIVFTFLAAPAILTNASTLMTLSTGNRLARSVDRMRVIANGITSPLQNMDDESSRVARQRLIEQFRPASQRCRVLIRALRACYTAVGSFAAGTCVAMLGATLSYFQQDAAARTCVTIMLAIAGVGMLSIVYAAVNLVRETTSTLDLLHHEEQGISARVGRATADGQR